MTYRMMIKLLRTIRLIVRPQTEPGSKQIGDRRIMQHLQRLYAKSKTGRKLITLEMWMGQQKVDKRIVMNGGSLTLLRSRMKMAGSVTATLVPLKAMVGQTKQFPTSE